VRLQVTGECCAVAFQLGIRQGHPHIAERRPISELLAGTLENLDHRLVGAQVYIQGNTSRAFVIPEIRLHCSCPLYLSVSGPHLGFLKGGALRTLAAMAIQANTRTSVIDSVNLVPEARPDQAAIV
jgi:hypothetical protein